MKKKKVKVPETIDDILMWYYWQIIRLRKQDLLSWFVASVRILQTEKAGKNRREEVELILGKVANHILKKGWVTLKGPKLRCHRFPAV